MKKIMLNIKWIDELLPDGFPMNTSTLVSGPGGSGKPLVGYMFASAYANQNGKLVIIITSTDRQYVINTMKIFGTDLAKINDRVYYIELDPSIDGIEAIEENWIKANLLKPEIWDEIIKKGNEYTGGDEMVIASALNLLFFSKTYGEKVYQKLKGILKNDKDRTYFFTINSDAFKEKAQGLESISDNLMFSRMEQPMKLYLKIARMKGVRFSEKETQVPLSKDVLKSIKEEAERGKKNLIPAISRI